MKFTTTVVVLSVLAPSLAIPQVFTVPMVKDTLKPKYGLPHRDVLKWRTKLGKPVSHSLQARAKVINQPASNQISTYTASVGVGSPATTFQLLVDTGSSNTWVGAGSTKFKKTSTSVDKKETVAVTYGSGSFSGEEWTDTVTLGSFVVKNQGLGAASSSSGFSGVDGILGLGPVDLTAGTTSRGELIPTVIGNGASQGTIAPIVSIYFHQTNSTSGLKNGEITYGGTDSSKLASSIQYFPITKSSPASYYWGLDGSAKYGSTIVLSSTSGIVDTGTTLVLLASNAFQAILKATGGTVDPNTGLVLVSSAANVKKLQTFYFTFSGKNFAITPSKYIVPPGQVTAYGGVSGQTYLLFGDLGGYDNNGLNFIAGLVFLEQYVSIYDTKNSRIGLATRK